MTEIDDDLIVKIIETHTDMKHVRKTLEIGAETFKTHDERIKDLELSQSKLMGIVIVIGTATASVVQIVLWLWDKLKWK